MEIRVIQDLSDRVNTQIALHLVLEVIHQVMDIAFLVDRCLGESKMQILRPQQTLGNIPTQDVCKSKADITWKVEPRPTGGRRSVT